MMKTRLYYLDFLRILATIAVVMIHVTGMRWLQKDIYDTDWDIYNICRAMSRWAVPMFVLISGTLFLNSKTLNIKKIYCKNLLRIIVSFLFWYVIFAIFQTRGHISEILVNPFQYIGHLWFLILIGILYIFLPIIRKVYENGGEKVLIIFAIWAFFVPACLETLPFLFGVDFLHPKALLCLKIIQKIFGWISYFMLGGYLGNCNVRKGVSFSLVPIFIFTVLTSIFLYKWYVISNDHMVDEFYDNISITVLVESVSLFLIFKGTVPTEIKSKIIYENIIRFSSLTYAVYLSHMLFLPLLTSFCEYESFCSILLIFTSLIGSISLAFALSYLLNKVRILKRFIV